MHISLVAGRKTRGYIRYLHCFISFTAWLAAAVDDGAQEQEYPSGAYYDVEYPTDQE